MNDHATTYRPTILARQASVASSHYLATTAGMRILQQGGNVVDAGVAAGLCINVLQPHMTSLGGVAPIILHLAAEGRTVVIDGLGTWPAAANIDYFLARCAGDLPEGVLRSVMPAAADAWLTALANWGSLPLAQVAAPAIDLAERGFPVYESLRADLAAFVEDFRRWPGTAEILLPGGRVPAVGQLLVQRDLARTLRRLVEASERGGIAAARDLFYRGEMARTMADFCQAQGGLLRYDDLAAFHVRVEEPVLSSYREYTIASCGPWCQGPMVNQVLALLEPLEMASLGHNSTAYLHTLTEAFKLAYADRERYFGDPLHVAVPLADLLDPAYLRRRAGQIDPDAAWPGLPPAGLPGNAGSGPALRQQTGGSRTLDTSYVCAGDASGNLFSATPSDSARDTPMVPGLGLIISPRGSQSWLDPDHPSSLQPGKRPRLTPCPALAFREGRPFLAFGTPGGDTQIQAMVQFFLNLVEFGMEPQAAVEAPRLASESFPNSFWPHGYRPGWLNVEARVPEAVRLDLAALGHDIHLWPDFARAAGSPCAIVLDPAMGTLMAGADPRRENYALGW